MAPRGGWARGSNTAWTAASCRPSCAIRGRSSATSVRRPAYRELLQQFLFDLDLDEETRRRAELNPLRVLDDKRPQVREMTAGAPLMLDHLSDAAKAHFDTVLAHLEA